MSSCAVDSCPRAPHARGWCDTHYTRWKRYGDVRADQPVRPPGTPVCGCGTLAAYRRGCRCDACRRSNARAKRRQYQRRTVPAGRVRRHAEQLLAAGMTRRQISERADLPYTTLAPILRGDVVRVAPETADAILGLALADVGVINDRCEECGAPPLAGGRWCLPCFDARTLPRTPAELDELHRRREVAERKRRQRLARRSAA